MSHHHQVVIEVETDDGYITTVTNPIITNNHNAVNEPGVALVRGPGDPDAGGAVCRISKIKRLEVV